MQKVMKADLELTRHIIDNPERLYGVRSVAGIVDAADDPMENADYFRQIFTRYVQPENGWEDMDCLRELLVSKLVLASSDYAAGGAGGACSGFLCAEVEDKDLPWDLSETDW